jgi:hypothetical protein
LLVAATICSSTFISIVYTPHLYQIPVYSIYIRVKIRILTAKSAHRHTIKMSPQGERDQLQSPLPSGLARPEVKGEEIEAPPRPSPLPAGEGIKGRGKEGEKRKKDFHSSWCPEGA